MIPDESTPKFSPPPWHRDQWGHIIDSAGEPVQFKGVSIAMGKDATAEANTDLATAAPALYEACRMVRQVGLTPAVKRQVVSALILAEEGGDT